MGNIQPFEYKRKEFRVALWKEQIILGFLVGYFLSMLIYRSGNTQKNVEASRVQRIYEKQIKDMTPSDLSGNGLNELEKLIKEDIETINTIMSRLETRLETCQSSGACDNTTQSVIHGLLKHLSTKKKSI